MSHTSKGRLGATLAPLSDGGVLSQILRYNDNPITFRTIGGALMVNATQMAKPFAKRPNDWLRLPITRKFISIIQREKKRPIVFTGVGGWNGGTYIHEDIAIEFARWLSPAYAVWCNDRIKELFRQGVAQQHPQEQPQPQSPEMLTIDGVLQRLREATDLVTALKQERAERERLEAILANIKSQIDSVPSRVERLPILIPELF